MAHTGTRRIRCAAMLAICAAAIGAAAPARAVTLTVTSTEAGAADGLSLFGASDPLTASQSETVHLADS